MKKLETILPFNYVHYYAFSMLIGLIGFEIKWMVLLYIPFYFLIRSYKFKYIVLLFGVLTFISLHFIKQPTPPTNQIFQITDITDHNTYYTYYAKQGKYVYLFNHQERFNIGDYVHIKYEVNGFSKAKTPNGFNAYNYYASKRIYYQLNIKEITLYKKGFHIRSIKYKLMDLFKDYPPMTRQMIYSLVFAHNSFSNEFKENASLLGVSHLFALSGMHINLLIIGLMFLFKKHKHKEIIVVVILTIYVGIVGFHLSLLRAYLMVLFSHAFKKQGITKLDSLSLAFILMLFINPFSRYRLGFILSFLVSLFLIIIPTKHKVLSNLIAYGSSLLFMSNINGGILIVSVFTSLIYTLIFPIVIMPLVLGSMIPGFYIISEPIFNGFELLYYLFKGYFLKMPYIGLLGMSIYLGLFIYIHLSNSKIDYIKRSVYLVLYLIFIYFIPHINPQGEVLFLDVGQGDTTVIKRPFNTCVIVIDAHRGSSDYLSTLGDIKIDYLFLTHGDYDHTSEAYKIVNTHNVLNVYTNPYDASELLSDMVVKRTKRGDKFVCGDVFIEVLSPYKDYGDDNDNSLVLKIKVDKQTYLFTGDISETVEQDLVSYYKTQLKSDYLHVSHHGSNTSTKEDFLMYVNPHTAIISVGINRYHHPHQEVLERLRAHQIKILKTIDENTIIIKKYSYRRKYQLLCI